MRKKLKIDFFFLVRTIFYGGGLWLRMCRSTPCCIEIYTPVKKTIWGKHFSSQTLNFIVIKGGIPPYLRFVLLSVPGKSHFVHSCHESFDQLFLAGELYTHVLLILRLWMRTYAEKAWNTAFDYLFFGYLFFFQEICALFQIQCFRILLETASYNPGQNIMGQLWKLREKMRLVK